jgi:hypothetical protein
MCLNFDRSLYTELEVEDTEDIYTTRNAPNLASLSDRPEPTIEVPLETCIQRLPPRSLQTIITAKIFRFPTLLTNESLLGIRRPKWATPAVVLERDLCGVFVSGIADIHEEIMRKNATPDGRALAHVGFYVIRVD